MFEVGVIRGAAGCVGNVGEAAKRRYVEWRTASDKARKESNYNEGDDG